MTMEIVTIPRPGALITFEQMEAAERQIASGLSDMDDIAAIEDTRDRLRAIEQYLRGKQMHLPALGAQRRLEARIGQLLGETSVGQRHDLEPSRVTEGSDVAKNDRADFRILAHGLNGTPLTDDEWRQSRRALVALLKDRTKEDHVATTVIEPTHGARISIPEGVTAEDWCRQGMAKEVAGQAAVSVAAEMGVGIHTYRKMRDIVLLSDRSDLSDRDAATVDRARRILNGTEQLSQAWPLIEPVAARVWGPGVKGTSRERVEKNRLDQFEHAFGLLLQACKTVSDFDLPYLSADRVSEACAQVDEASRNLAALKRRLAEVRG